MNLFKHRQLESFIYTEARLLDEKKYDAWLDMYSNDSTYWIPSWDSLTETVNNINAELSLMYLNRTRLEDFVFRLNSGDAHAIEPPPRVSRHLTNILIEEGEEPSIHCKWVMHVYRNNVQEIFSGDCEYKLCLQDGQLKIKMKKVILNNDLIERGHLMLV